MSLLHFQEVFVCLVFTSFKRYAFLTASSITLIHLLVKDPILISFSLSPSPFLFFSLFFFFFFSFFFSFFRYSEVKMEIPASSTLEVIVQHHFSNHYFLPVQKLPKELLSALWNSLPACSESLSAFGFHTIMAS